MRERRAEMELPVVRRLIRRLVTLVTGHRPLRLRLNPAHLPEIHTAMAEMARASTPGKGGAA